MASNRRTIPTYHLHNLRVYVLGDYTSLGGDILQHFVQGLRLDLLAFEFGVGIVEVEDNGALVQFLDEQLGPFADRSFLGAS